MKLIKQISIVPIIANMQAELLSPWTRYDELSESILWYLWCVHVCYFRAQ